MKKRNNPFILTGYSGTLYFCNRQKETEWLIDQWQNERNVVLYSWRRMGKTALIRHLFYTLNKQKKVRSLYVDLLGTSSQSDAVQRIATAVIDEFGSLNKGMSNILLKLVSHLGATIALDPFTGLPQVEFSITNPPEPIPSLKAIGEFLGNQNSKVVLALDEFQQIVYYEDTSAEATFRTWAQENPDIRLIFSGSHRHMMNSMFSESNRPFYRSAQLMELESIASEDYSKFIKSLFKKGNKKIDQQHIDTILEWARFQTYYVQLTCNKLFGRTDDVTQEDILAVMNETLEQESPLFGQFKMMLTNKQWQILKAIALEEDVPNPFSQSFIKKYDLGAASSVNAAIKALLEKEILIYWDERYTLHDTLLMRWLQRY